MEGFMKLKNILGGFVLAFFTILIYFYFTSGAFKGVEVTAVEIPKFQFYYKENIGPYHQIIDRLTQVEKAFEKLDIKCHKTFGLFLSDPEREDHDKLKSHVGCAFSPEESPQLYKTPPGVKESFYSLPISSESELERVKCFKGVFKGSPSLTAIKVYSKIKEEADKKGVKLFKPILEIYEEDGSLNSMVTSVYRCGV